MSVNGFRFKGTVHKYNYDALYNKPVPDTTLTESGKAADAKSVGDALAEIRHAVGSPLVASTVTQMTDTSKIYVYTGSESGYTKGNWYYYNSSSWVSGGVYNSSTIETDKTLSAANAAADSKKTGDEISALAESISKLYDAIALDFEPDRQYKIGDLLWHNGKLYCTKEDVQLSEWDADYFDEATVDDSIYIGLSLLSNRLESYVADLSGDIADAENYMTTLGSWIRALEVAMEDVSIDPDDLGLEQDSDTYYVYPTYRGVRSENGIPLASGGGGGGGGGGDIVSAVLTVTNTSGWLSKTIAAGSSCPISLNWSSIEDSLPTGDGNIRITVNESVRTIYQIQQGDVTVDLAPYLSSGANKVKVRISDTYDQGKTITFNITSVVLTVSSTFDATNIYNTEPINYPYTPVGEVEKTVHFIVDGTDIGTEITTVSGRQMTYVIPGQTHGSHTLRVYFTATINNETVRSNELYYEFICVEEGNNSTIITSDFNETTMSQYSSIVIPFMVFNPTDLTAEVTIKINGNTVSSQTVDRTKHTYTYRANDAGTLTISIESGGTVKQITLTITEAEIDVEAETRNLALYLTSQGRSNQEANPDTWTYGTGDDQISCSFSGFSWTSDGWQTDKDGVTVLRVSGDARVTIPYKPFASDSRIPGKTIELEFATRNVLDYDAVILSCFSGNRGFSVTAQKALLKSEQSEISTQYKEDEHVRIAFVIEKRAENRLLFIYINGIVSGVVQYPTDDDFSQISPVDITIGSSDCTIDMYCIRVYDNNLTRYQIVDNWIADTQNGAEMMDRYLHNNVYDTYGNVVIDKLPSDLPYMIIECAELPQYKGDKKTCSGRYVDTLHPSKSFTFTGAQIDVQGTSSQYYARKNYKVKFNNGFDTPNGNISKYAMNADAIPVKTFCFKADVASSEGANNVELVRIFNEACPYKTPAQRTNPKVRQGIDGFPMVVFWNDTVNNRTSFLGKYNFNNDKSTEDVFGFADDDESWEIKNNTGNRVLWKSADYSGTDWLNDFEARFPDIDPPYTNPAQLSEFATWAMSTDRTTATGNALPSPVTYGSGDDAVTYTNDTADYRLAKFKAEAGNYMEIDSTLFFYLFTELFLMVDNRAKNAFPSFMGMEV